MTVTLPYLQILDNDNQIKLFDHFKAHFKNNFRVNIYLNSAQ